jgi:hypothetical protein
VKKEIASLHWPRFPGGTTRRLQKSDFATHKYSTICQYSDEEAGGRVSRSSRRAGSRKEKRIRIIRRVTGRRRAEE